MRQPGGRPNGLGSCEDIRRRARSAEDRDPTLTSDLERCAASEHAAGARLRWLPDTLALANGRRIPAEQAVLRVPERRSDSASREIAIGLLRLTSRRPSNAAPMLFLDGAPDTGPSNRTIRLPSIFAFFDSLRETRDIILMDYRGSGRSTPIRCPAVESMPPDLFASREAAARFFREQARACAERARAEGVDLLGYTWKEVAADVEAIRRALGVPRMDLLGFSSGTHAALATLKYHETGVGRIVLIGTEGLNHTRKLPSDLDRQLARIADLVRRDTVLSRQVPDFTGMLRAVLDRAERAPFLVRVANPGGDSVSVPVGRYALAYLASKSVSGPGEMDFLVGLIAALHRGDPSLLQRVVQRTYARPAAPHALMALLDGSAGVTRERAERIRTEANTAILGDAANFPLDDLAAAWGYADLGDAYRAPVRSTVPALFITGALDGNTPPRQAEEVRSGFPNSVHVVVANAGHSTPFQLPAVTETIDAFLRGDDVRGRSLAAPPIRLTPPAP